jgi:hypothetical protein
MWHIVKRLNVFATFIDAPAVERQKQPGTDKDGMENNPGKAKGRYRVLYAGSYPKTILLPGQAAKNESL